MVVRSLHLRGALILNAHFAELPSPRMTQSRSKGSSQYSQGQLELRNDMSLAIKLWTEAAELGSADAHYNLGLAYDCGPGVERMWQGE